MADDEYDFFLCIGDELPSIQETLQNGDGTTPDLTSATVAFVIQDANHQADPFGGAAGVVGDPTKGIVQYNWQNTDAAAAGVYLYRWRVTYPGTKPETYPNGKSPRRLLVSAAT
jgi:hypothetical protein